MITSLHEQQNSMILSRLHFLDEFSRIMGDIRIEMNPMAQVVTIVFNNRIKDVYYDTQNAEESRCDKKVLLNKKYDLWYAQDMFDTLIEQTEDMPWIMELTITDLPRPLQIDDQVLVGKDVYTVSQVAPKNRGQRSIQKVLLYNERTTKVYDPSDDIKADENLF